MKRIPLAAVAISLASVLAACGGSPGGDADDGVASIDPGTTVADSTGDGDADADDADPEEAMLEYTQCMRDHGIDLPDPQFGDNGEITMSIGDGEGEGPGIDIGSDEYQAAEETCRPIMDDAVGSIEIDPEQQAEMREQLLEYAQCMRDQGLDFPDPVFSDNGTVTMMGPGGPDGGPPSESEREAMDAANEICAVEGGPIAMPARPASEEG